MVNLGLAKDHDIIQINNDKMSKVWMGYIY